MTARSPLRLLAHALRSGDGRLAALLAARLFPGAPAGARRTMLLLLERFGL